MTTGVACPQPILQFFLPNGQLNTGGFVAPTVGGIATAVYQDQGLTTPLPLGSIPNQTATGFPLNSLGQPSNAAGASQQVFLTPNTVYMFTVYDSSGNQINQTSYVNGVQVAITQAAVGQALYPQTPAESAAGVTPTNFAYAPGDIRRYGAKIDGVTDDTTAINHAISVAIAGFGFVYHPGGTCVHASQILAAGGWSLLGYDRKACIFNYTGVGTSSAWRITNNGTSSPTPNSSGFGLWNFDGVAISTAAGTSNTAAGVEINACGYAFYEMRSGARITGGFKYGLIFDGAEVSHVHKGAIIDNNGPSGAANIWLTNGPDRTPSQGTQFTNSITIESVQLNVSGTGSFNIIDDGGSDHNIVFNNCNGAVVPIRVAAVEGLKILNNELENALGAGGSGAANILFTNTTAVGGATVGPCQGFEVGANFLGADMGASSSSLKFAGAMHQGGTIKENWFRNNNGRIADIDVTFLSNSFCAQNYVSAPGGQHYNGVHNDANGNILWPPQNGYGGGFNQNAYTWGDTRFRHYFTTGIRNTKIVVPYSASITFDCRQGNIFQIVATNNTAFTINTPTGDPVNGDDGTIITVQIKNSSGGALGVITFGGLFKLTGGAFTAPANGNNRSITFYDDNVTGAWYEISRTAADVPN